MEFILMLFIVVCGGIMSNLITILFLAGLSWGWGRLEDKMEGHNETNK